MLNVRIARIGFAAAMTLAAGASMAQSTNARSATLPQAQSASLPTAPALGETGRDAASALPASTPLALPKRLLAPRTGSATPSGISGVSGTSGYSEGRANGINTGTDPSRGGNGAGGTVAPVLGSIPLKRPAGQPN